MKQLQKALDFFSTLNFSLIKKTVLLTDSLGYVLAEDIFSDVNMPPFNKSAMNRYACRKSDLSQP